MPARPAPGDRGAARTASTPQATAALAPASTEPRVAASQRIVQTTSAPATSASPTASERTAGAVAGAEAQGDDDDEEQEGAIGDRVEDGHDLVCRRMRLARQQPVRRSTPTAR